MIASFAGNDFFESEIKLLTSSIEFGIVKGFHREKIKFWKWRKSLTESDPFGNMILFSSENYFSETRKTSWLQLFIKALLRASELKKFLVKKKKAWLERAALL